MLKPLVVIVGRPNVGKSTLFNRIVRSKAAIVEDIPGVTRDRNYREAEWEGRSFIVVDTGGFYPEPQDNIFKEVREQAMFAIEEADLIIHLMDGKEGLNPGDIELTKILRESGKRFISVVNKIDVPSKENRLYDFYQLGVNEILPLSAETGYAFSDLMDKVISLLPEKGREELPLSYPKVAVVGRPNVGKSTLINTLLGKERMIVSPVAGTTRDAIDSVCRYYGRPYLLIDTAGIRRKGKVAYPIERYSTVRAIRSIERCDVAIIVLDSVEGIVEQDKKIAGLVNEYGKGAIFLFNKWDLVEDPEVTYRRYIADFEREIWFFNHAPLLTISAIERKRVTKVFPLIDRVMEERRKRIRTSELNKFFEKLKDEIIMPAFKGKAIKVYYMTQTGVEPPEFVIFTNQLGGLKEEHIRFIEKRLRREFSFMGTPIRIYARYRK
ncbi:MAG: ribosome biogenesis GTPase Der [Thermodesulfovibrionales bacterium]